MSDMAGALTQLADAVGHSAGEELGAALQKIKHCLGQLTDEQIWWRESEGRNSIANLLLHLCGNLRQWIVSGVGGVPDIRERQKEFDERRPIEMAHLIQQVEQTVHAAQTVLRRVTSEELLQVRRIQGFDVTAIQAIFDSVAHFRGHTQEIVHITRSLLDDDYKFDFVPASTEQGALQA